MLDLFDIRKSFGSRTLFSGVNLRVNPRDRLGLVGPNGTGKTTLFRIILNEISPDSGRVEVQKNIRMGYLAGVHRVMGRRLAEYCVNAAASARCVKERAACVAELERLGHGDDNDAAHVALAKKAGLSDRLLAVDADHMPGMARSILVGWVSRRKTSIAR